MIGDVMENQGAQYTKILVPMDGSENSSRAANVAIDLAKDNNAQLTVFTVIPLPNVMGFGPPPTGLEEYYKIQDRESEALLERVISDAAKRGVKASGEKTSPVTSVVSSILDFAQQNRIDLIIIGTRGLGGFKRTMLGSVSTGVVTHAHCDVLIVR